MTICHLSISEALAFEHHGIIPQHDHHRHVDFDQAIELIRQDLARAVGQGVRAICPQASNDRVWKNRMSGGYQCRQFVRIVQD